MQIELDKESQEFRTELRQWIEDNRPKGLERLNEMTFYGSPNGLSDPDREAYEAWIARLLDARLICPQWPEEVGGRGLSGLHMAILNEEFVRARVPRVIRGGAEILVGPSIIVHGTPEQKAYFLPRILSGEDTYCQGF